MARWRYRKSCSKKELQSFTGHLAHAAIVIRPERIFLRSLFSLLAGVHRSYFRICLNSSIRVDLQWWHCFLQASNGSSFFPAPVPSTHIYSDASGTVGCGAIDSTVGWFQLTWPGTCWMDANIATKELLPIVVAAALWGASWRGSHVCFHCDNAAVVSVINKHSAKDKVMVHLLRCLFF